MGEDQKLLQQQTEKVWKRKLCHPHRQGILMFFSGMERKEMKRGKETEERERLKVFICLLAGCVKLRDVWREQKLARNMPVTRSEIVLRCKLKICMLYYVTWAHKILSLKAFEWLQSTYTKFRRKTPWDASSYFQRSPNHKQTEELTSTVYNIRKPITKKPTTIQNTHAHIQNKRLSCLANPT